MILMRKKRPLSCHGLEKIGRAHSTLSPSPVRAWSHALAHSMERTTRPRTRIRMHAPAAAVRKHMGVAAPASLPTRTRGPLRLRGLPSPEPPSRPYSWNICNTKNLLQHTSEIDQTFTIYVCNICV
jgi:hypothetical protein